MVRNIDVALLRSFLCVAERGSIGSAARALNLTQGAVSQRLARLEDVLQCRLFDRDHSGARLSRHGGLLLVEARAMVELNDAICERHGIAVDAIRLGAPPDIVSEIMPRLLRRFSDRMPSANVSLVTAPSIVIERGLRSGEVDLALLEHPDHEDRGAVLHSSPLVWIGAAGGGVWRSEELPVSISHEACRFRDAVREELAAAGRQWRPVLDGEGWETTVAAVRADVAVTASIASLVPTGTVVLDDPNLPALPGFSISLSVAAGRRSRAADELAGLLRDEVPAILADGLTHPPSLQYAE